MNEMTPHQAIKGDEDFASEAIVEPAIESTVRPSFGASTPQASDFEKLLSSLVATTITMHKWRFEANGNPLTADDVAGNGLLLPAVLWQAEKNHQLLCGKSLGVQFRSDQEASLGARAVLDVSPGVSRSIYPLFCLEVLVQALENFTLEGPDSSVSAPEIRENILLGRKVPPKGAAATLDHLVQGFFQDHELGLVPWTSDSNPRSPNLG